MPEIFIRFPKSFFNERGELIYDKKENFYILPERFHELGKTKVKRKGWNQDIWYFQETWRE